MIIPFTPSSYQVFQFQADLDGQTYNCIVSWNAGGQRWYLTVYDLAGNQIFSKPMIGSPLTVDLDIAWPYFKSTIVYRVQDNQIEISP